MNEHDGWTVTYQKTKFLICLKLVLNPLSHLVSRIVRSVFYLLIFLYNSILIKLKSISYLFCTFYKIFITFFKIRSSRLNTVLVIGLTHRSVLNILDSLLANQIPAKGVVTIVCRMEIRKMAEC